MASAGVVPLRAESAVGSFFEGPHDEPVILFQHDLYCPIGRRAYRELTGVPIEVALVDVARDADITRAIEERTAVPHESPQVLVLRSGRVVWTASTSRLPALRLHGRCGRQPRSRSTSSPSPFAAPLAGAATPL